MSVLDPIRFGVTKKYSECTTVWK